MGARVFTIPLSHPARCAVGMLRQAGVRHRVLELPAGLQPVILRAAGFGGVTVPAVRLDDGRRLQGTRSIARELDATAPRCGLFPVGTAGRAAVREAERWGEEVLQPLPRRLIRRALQDDPELRRWFTRTTSPFPAPDLTATLLAPIIPLFVAQAGASPERVQADRAELPALLDRVDELLAHGVIGGDVPNAADWQIGTTVRALLAFESLAPQIAGRPAEALARRLVPEHVSIPA
jgi:glutathione S-transferase